MERVGFDSIDSRRIFYAIAEPKGADTIVIMCHRLHGDSTGPSRMYVRFARVLQKHSIATLRFDFPGRGHSSAELADIDYESWVSALKHFINQASKHYKNIFLLGSSIGAHTATVVAGDADYQYNLQGLLLWMPDPVLEFNLSPAKVYEKKGQLINGSFWQAAAKADFLEKLHGFTGPVYVVYGDADESVDAHSRRAVVDMVKINHGQHYILHGQGHGEWTHASQQRVFETSLEFIKQNR